MRCGSEGILLHSACRSRVFKACHADLENGGEMFNPLNKIYKQYGIDTEDLIYYLLTFDDIRSRYDENSDEYKYCMSELQEILLEDHDASFLDKCIDFVNLCSGNYRLMNAITNREFDMMDVDKVMSSYQLSIEEEKLSAEEICEVDEINQEVAGNSAKYSSEYLVYRYPTIDLLLSKTVSNDISKAYLEEQAKVIQKVLSYNGMQATITEVTMGPRTIIYTLEYADTISVANIKAIQPDLALALAVKEIEVLVPIPGTSNVGIKIKRYNPETISLKDVIADKRDDYIVPIGKDDFGKDITIDFNTIDNLLIAGTTGSGKSELIDSIISYLLMKMSPADIRFVLIDTHMIQFALYNGIPHLLLPVVMDVERAVGTIHWLIKEAYKRIEIFTTLGVKDIHAYNNRVKAGEFLDREGKLLQKLTPIFCFVDDYTDIVSQYPVAQDEFAQLCRVARIAGIHLICSIQRPTVNVITGAVKTNFKSRLSFKVTSALESRIVLDCKGAENIYEHGVYLYRQEGKQGVIEGQSVFVSESEIKNIVNFLKLQSNFETDIDSKLIKQENKIKDISNRDSLFAEAGRLVIENQKGSIGYLQRNFRIGFNRAAQIMDQLAEEGVVGPELGTNPREIKMTINEFERLLNE